MAASIKPGVDLLWAYQIRREHTALLERLISLEKTTTAQQERLDTSDKHDFTAQDEKIKALEQQVKELQDFDASQQIAVFAREAREEFGRVHDRVKKIQQSSRQAESDAEKKDVAVQRKVEELKGVVRRLEGNLQGVEGRLELADCPGLRRAVDGARLTSEHNDRRIEQLGEQLGGMEQALGDMRVLFEGLKLSRTIDSVPAAASAAMDAPIFEDMGINAAHAGALTPPPPAKVAKKPPAKAKKAPAKALTQMAPAVVEGTSETAAHGSTPNLPPPKHPKKKASGKAKTNFDKELTQLMHGDGFLTNAQIITASSDVQFVTRASRKREADQDDEALAGIESQSQPHVTRGNNKKRKAEARAEQSQPAMSQREIRTRKVAREEPTAPRAAFKAVSKANPTEFSQAKPAPRKKNERKRPVPPKWPGLKRPLALPSSDDVQVVNSQEHLISEGSPSLAGRPQNTKANLRANVKNVEPPRSTAVPKAQEASGNKEQRQQHGRRRIQQDDSMEDFLAKCQAVADT